jgi:tRNA-(ms[2]io[6]A)-hydroxylase
MFCLQSKTDDKWLALVIANVDKLLADHAYCEKKAAASAMSLIGRYPDDEFLVPKMIELAREELEHFERIYTVLRERGGSLGNIDKDPYVQELLPLCRKNGTEALIDRLLVASLIEARSAERFFLLAEHLPDADLRALYRELAVTESGHHTTFVNLAFHYAGREEVKARLAELSAEEAAIVERLPVAPRMH